MNQLRKIVAEFDVNLPEDLTQEQFLKLMVDYLHLNRFVINVDRADLWPINSKVSIVRSELPESDVTLN